MALITKPFKRSGTWDRCAVKASYHHTSKILGIGEEHLVLDITMAGGKVSILEIPITEAKKIIEQINSKQFTETTTLKKLSWAERAIEYAKK